MKHLVVCMLSFSIAFSVNSQNLVPNRYSEYLISQPATSCIPGTFWSSSYSMYKRFSFDGVTPPVLDSNILGNGYSGIGYTSNIAGLPLSPTFFIGAGYVVCYNGSTFLPFDTLPGHALHNGGGASGVMYFTANHDSIPSASPNRKIVSYYNGNFNIIYDSEPDRGIMGADVAADAAGNCYFFVGDNSNISFPFVDSLIIMDPLGNRIETYSMSFPHNHLYGMMIFEGTLYLGFGNSNPLYPNQLVPVILNGGNATLGTPFPFVLALPYDLECCNQGYPLGVPMIPDQIELSIYPNPAKENIKLEFKPEPGHGSIKLLDINCKIVYDQKIDPFVSNVQFDITSLSGGIYMCILEWPGHIIKSKIVKM